MNMMASPKLCPGLNDLDHLLGALRGREAQLDLTIDQHVEAGTGIALPEQRFSLGDPLLMHAFGHFGQLFRRQSFKQGNTTQKGIDLVSAENPACSLLNWNQGHRQFIWHQSATLWLLI
jgi:hypothetical protein